MRMSLVSFAAGLLLAAGTAPASPGALSEGALSEGARSGALAGPQPSWFPEVSCDEAWSHQDIFRYDHDNDSRVQPGFGNSGYSNFVQRINSETGLRRSECYKEWTVLVYMAADNDLSPYAFWDLHEMEGSFRSGRHAGSTLRSDLLVELDTAGDSGIRRLHIFQNPSSKPYQPALSKEEFRDWSFDRIHSPIALFIPEQGPVRPSDHATRLKSFLDWGMKAYPARHYFVIVWGHGQGWAPDLPATPANLSLAPGPTDTNPFRNRFGGIAFDDSKNDFLSIPSLARVLDDAYKVTLEGRRRVDVYASDACLMQMVEVAYEISDSSRFIVGSSQVQSYLGLPYRQLMYGINTGRIFKDKWIHGADDPAYALVRALPSLVEKSLDPVYGQQGRADKKAIDTFTISALNSAELRNRLVPEMARLSSAILEYFKEDPFRPADFQHVLRNTPSFMGGSRELGSFLGLLEIQLKNETEYTGGVYTAKAEELLFSVKETKQALSAVAVSYGYGRDYQSAAQSLHLLGFRGVGIWLPQTIEQLNARFDDFKASSLYQDWRGNRASSEWEEWIAEVFPLR